MEGGRRKREGKEAGGGYAKERGLISNSKI